MELRSRFARLLALGLCIASGSSAQEVTPPKAGSAPNDTPSNGAAPSTAPPSAPNTAPASGVVPPALLRFVDAAYPPAAQRAGLTADVLLRLRVETDGTVSEVEVLEPAGHGFDEAATAAARKFLFAPATVNGQPVAVRIPFKYSFTLTQEEVEAELPPTTGNLTGRVLIAGPETPLAGARITISAVPKVPGGTASAQSSTLTSAADGSWTLPDLPPGEYTVKVEADGFRGVELREDVSAGEIAELTYRMSPDLGPAIEVSVYGTRPPREILRRTITRREMRTVPGSGGDALRSLQNLPGLARPPALAGLLIVRGSAPEDSVAFVDGDAVPFIYHFGGLSSSVPTELLERIDFYPGNFSARYGRVMGGVVDVGLRAPDTSCRADYGKPGTGQGCFHGLLQADLIDTRLLLQGPLPAEGWSFAVGARRSWVDAWVKPVLEAAGAGVTTAPVYYDYQVIAERSFARGSRWSLRLFGSDDRVEVLIENPAAQDPGAFGGNLTLGTSFVHMQSWLTTDLSRDVTLTSLLSVGKDTARFELGRFVFDAVSYPIQMRNEFAFRLARGVTLNTGLDFQVAPFEILVRAPEPPRPGEPSPGPFSTRPLLETTQESTFFRPGWYADAQLRFGHTTVTPGFRVDYARDTAHTDLSPRLMLRHDLTLNQGHEDGSMSRRTTLKAAAGVFHQPAQPQETDEVFGTPGLESNRAFHYSIGFERELNDQIELNLEGFYKDLRQLVSRSATLDGSFEYGNRGSGYVVGGEALLKYKEDERFFGWIAYTLSRSMRRDAPGEDAYPFQFDQTHILTLLGSYKLSRGWEVGARFRLVSGPLDTPVRSFPDLAAVFAADAAAYTPLSAEPFSDRLPLFHQLDLRVEKTWQFRRFLLAFFIDVWNAYNHAAAETYSYNFDFSRRTYQQGLPIVPSLGFRGEF
jgi:TonB family protein